jgi:hypothetical protein
VVIGYSYGYLIGLFGENEEPLQNETKEDVEHSQLQSNTRSVPNYLESLATDQEAEVITLETLLVFERFYKECQHRKIEQCNVSLDHIGLSENEFSQLYSTWEIKEFSPSKIWLKKEINTYCPEHYIIKDKNGCIAIYQPLEDNDGIWLIEQTKVNTALLDIETQNRIREGIVVDSIEEIEGLIENWDS